MAIKKIFEYLKKFEDVLASSQLVPMVISESIAQVTHIQVPYTKIRTQSNIIHIALRGVEKSEILLQKEKILELISSKIKEKYKDIQ